MGLGVVWVWGVTMICRLLLLACFSAIPVSGFDVLMVIGKTYIQLLTLSEMTFCQGDLIVLVLAMNVKLHLHREKRHKTI